MLPHKLLGPYIKWCVCRSHLRSSQGRYVGKKLWRMKAGRPHTTGVYTKQHQEVSTAIKFSNGSDTRVHAYDLPLQNETTTPESASLLTRYQWWTQKRYISTPCHSFISRWGWRYSNHFKFGAIKATQNPKDVFSSQSSKGFGSCPHA